MTLVTSLRVGSAGATGRPVSSARLWHDRGDSIGVIAPGTGLGHQTFIDHEWIFLVDGGEIGRFVVESAGEHVIDSGGCGTRAERAGVGGGEAVAVPRSGRVPEVRVRRVARRVLGIVAVGAIGLIGAACSDDESTIDPDTPVSAVDAEVVEGGDEAPTSPGTLTVTGVDGVDGGGGDGSDPAAPDGQVPDRSTVPPAQTGAGDGTGGDGADGGDPPDVSTRPSG